MTFLDLMEPRMKNTIQNSTDDVYDLSPLPRLFIHELRLKRMLHQQDELQMKSVEASANVINVLFFNI